ncbi:MAG: glycosyltransferase family 4 protein [Treponema sp.]|nr:glycosyltransferase family 4 protein [Candidatus Treponema equifaecale]
MLRIAIDCRMIGSGGIGSFIHELIPFFLENNQCLLIGTHEQCMDFVRLSNVEFCYCDVKPFSLQEMFNFPQDVLDAIHKYDFYFTPYCNIPSGIELPIFSTIHDIVFLDVKGLTGTLGRIGRKFFYKRAVNYSEEIFTVSEFSKERIQKQLKCKKPLPVIYNGVSTYLTEPFESEVEKNDQILFVGNIKKHKGLKVLLDAFEIAGTKGFSSKLVIVGNKDNFRTGDEETVSRLNKMPSEKVQFTGKISNHQLKTLYAQSKFLVQPSLYEGFGIPPLEAMTVGTPALISDIPVFKEIYGDFPVQFFKSENAEDLAEKLLNFDAKKVDISEIGKKYSYKASAEKIIETLTNYKK